MFRTMFTKKLPQGKCMYYNVKNVYAVQCTTRFPKGSYSMYYCTMCTTMWTTMCFTMCFTVVTTMLTTMYTKSFPREIHCRTHQPEFRQQWKRPLRIGSQKFTSNKTQFVKLACLLSIFLRRALLINTVGSKSLSFDICCTKIHLHNIFYNWGHFCKPTLFQNIHNLP